MAYQISYTDHEPRGNSMHIVIAIQDHRYTNFDHNFFELINELIEMFYIYEITVRFLSVREWYEEKEDYSKSYERKYRDVTKNRKYTTIEFKPCSTASNKNAFYKKRVKAIGAVHSGKHVRLVYIDEDYTDTARESVSKSGLYNLLREIEKIESADFDVYVSDSVIPMVSERERSGIMATIEGASALSYNVPEWCMCQYNICHETNACLDCQWCNREALINNKKEQTQRHEEKNLSYNYSEIGLSYSRSSNKKTNESSIDIDAINANREKMIKMLKGLKDKMMCESKEDAQQLIMDSCMQTKMVTRVFEFSENTGRQFVLAVAVTLRLNYKQLEMLMDAKGLSINTGIRILDAIVVYYLKNNYIVEGDVVDVEYINSALAGLGVDEQLGERERKYWR